MTTDETSRNPKKMVVKTDKPEKEYTEEELLVISTMKINSLEREITVYTDELTDEQQEKGQAGYEYPFMMQHTPSFWKKAILPENTACHMEANALQCCKHWNGSKETPHHILICTDSDSFVAALEEDNLKDGDPWLK